MWTFGKFPNWRPKERSKTLNCPHRLRLSHNLFVALELHLEETVPQLRVLSHF
jgi:hypothetical protein